MSPTTRSAPHDVLTSMRSRLTDMNPAEARLARSILNDPQTALGASVELLAAAGEVSTATVIRFCRNMGFEGLRDFRLALGVQLSSVARPQVPGTAGIAQQVLSANIQALQDTVALLDTAKVEQAASRLLEARQIGAFASGLSAPIAMDAAHRLSRLGLPVHYHMESYAQRIRASQLGAGDVALLITHSARTVLTAECARLAREAGALTLLITSAARSPMAAEVDITLITATMEAERSQEAVSSRLAHLAVVDILCAEVQEQAPERTSAALSRVREVETGRSETVKRRSSAH
ncbi:MurR/RpiR family transcriptional regulator [Deinococcus sp.]|uniref:MurR/RpiR family transcriptional regulator n=1 Tax=Deinococcus sp. TaxID=47478 RepID=UPI0025C1A8F2|nr:MurR/RpiR family transcriptional regulator [Deinococcus sp.]